METLDRNSTPQLPLQPPAPNIFRRMQRHVQTRTVAGLMQLVPLIVTLVVVAALVDYADRFIGRFQMVEGRPWDFPGIGLVILAVLFYLVGLAISSRLGRWVMDQKDRLLNILPLVGTIYGVTQQAAATMSSQERFNRVVFLEWPREGMFAMGFVTGRAVSPHSGLPLAIVYIPTVPNPTSGNMALVNEDDLVETDLTVEAAMKMVFSGGIVLPESVAFARVPRERQENELLDRFNTFQ